MADLTAIAAFTAAGLGVVNVGLTTWLSGRKESARWRRDAYAPRIAELSAASRKHNRAANGVKLKMIHGAGPAELKELIDDAYAKWLDVAAVGDEIDLMAPASVRKMVGQLIRTHGELGADLDDPEKLAGTTYADALLGMDNLEAARQDLIEAARRELGAEKRSFAVRLRRRPGPRA